MQVWDEQLSVLAHASSFPEFASLMQAPEINPEERSKALNRFSRPCPMERVIC